VRGAPAGFEHGRNWFDRDRFEPAWRVGFVPNGLSGAVCTRNIIAARGLKSRRRRCQRATQAISGSHQFRETRDKLIERLEQQTDAGAVNVNEMVRLYSREYDQPILTLMEDMQTQATVYYNVFEDLKKGSVSEDSAAVLKDRYVSLGLIPNSARFLNHCSAPVDADTHHIATGVRVGK